MTANTKVSGKSGQTKGGKKGEEPELPPAPIRPVFDYGVDKFNMISEEIWDARELMN